MILRIKEIKHTRNNWQFHAYKIFRATVFSVCLFLFSCTQTDFYNQYQVIDQKWEKGKEFYFTFNIEDNTSLYNLSIETRNNNTYPYQNLWLFCTEEQPIGPIWRDTVECMLADDFGKWYGTGLSIYHLSTPVRSNYKFPGKGQYTFSIRQGMRDNYLKGIEEIGLRIEKITEK
ncbi:MAG: gliding motility lipoprotein GldH [Tannerella sp.]|jgi:gliding motility-associated lipoprotein GldH|nr:gliding motility lipoprotein GldH [Tannerella sp.]